METYTHQGKLELDYIDTIQEVNTKFGNSTMTSHDRVVIHYSWDARKGDIINRIKEWGTYSIHEGAVPYHFVIPRDDEFRRPTVIMAQDENGATWHCGNYLANHNSLAICIDGQYNSSAGGYEKISKQQLAILQQLLSNIKTSSNIDCHLYNIDTSDSSTTVPYSGTVLSGQGRVVGHQEIADLTYGGTECPGDIQQYVTEWFEKEGNVGWIDDYLNSNNQNNMNTNTQLEELQNARTELNKLQLDLQNAKAEVQARITEEIALKDKIAEDQNRIFGYETERSEMQKSITELQTQLETCNKTLKDKVKDAGLYSGVSVIIATILGNMLMQTGITNGLPVEQLIGGLTVLANMVLIPILAKISDGKI